jgi:hypothetical protein
MPTFKLSRRDSLKALVVLPASAAFVSGCQSGPAMPDRCDDVSQLSEPEKTARAALQYVDHSPHPDKKCRGCQHYEPAPMETQCGGCKVVKGTIHPEGYCTSWAKKTDAPPT